MITFKLAAHALSLGLPTVQVLNGKDIMFFMTEGSDNTIILSTPRSLKLDEKFKLVARTDDGVDIRIHTLHVGENVKTDEAVDPRASEVFNSLLPKIKEAAIYSHHSKRVFALPRWESATSPVPSSAFAAGCGFAEA